MCRCILVCKLECRNLFDLRDLDRIEGCRLRSSSCYILHDSGFHYELIEYTAAVQRPVMMSVRHR